MARKIGLDILLKKPAPQDVIAAIFAYSGLKSFTNDSRKIQAFIRESKAGSAAKLLEPFTFSEGVGIYPYSRVLESVLAGLRLGGVIFTWSPRDDGYSIEEKMRRKVIAQTKERFSPEEITILKNLGEKWQKFNKRQV